MPSPRGWVTASVVNGKIYVIGGGSPSVPNYVTNEVYDPATDSWASKSPAPRPVYGGLGSVSAVVDGKIYVIGYSIQVYNTETDTWFEKNSTPPMSPASSPITSAGVIVDASGSEKVYVVGPNWDPYNPSNTIYDPLNDSWTSGASFPTQRYNFAVAVVNNTLYAVGGHTYDPGRGGYFEPVGLNEQYIPIQNITPTQSPPIEPSTSATPTHALTPTPSPIESPSVTATPSISGQPTPLPELTPIFPIEYIYVTVVIAAIVIMTATAFILKRKKKLTQNCLF